MYAFLNREKFVVLIFILFLFAFFKPQNILAADIGLIDAKTLNQSPSSWIVMDARPKNVWQSGHIPGARSFSWEDYTRTDEKGVAYRLLPAEQPAAALGKMGIEQNSPVAVYGDADTSWGGEGWVCWVLAFLGHKGPIRLVDGGIQAWTANGFPIKSGEEVFTESLLSALTIKAVGQDIVS